MARTRTQRVTRIFVSGIAFHVKSLSQSNFFILTSVIQPVIFASIAFFMFRAGGRAPTLLYAALGAGLMGIWSSTLFGSGGAIQWQRWQGTLELIVIVPPSMLQVLLPLTVATSAIGLYSVVATLVWGIVFFGMPLQLLHPFMFAVALIATVFGLGLLGLVLASTFVLYRHANALSNLLEYPVWLTTGVLVPLSLLPGWTHIIGWVLAPTWGIRALRAAALGGNPLIGIGMSTILGCVYLAMGSLFLRHFERLARDRGTLSLA
jgi:ABC-2 type transport system permease protein